MKVLIVGAKSIHNKNFLDSLPSECELHFVSETDVDYNQIKSTGIFSFRSKNPIHWLANYRRLKRHVKELNPDIIHIHQINRLAYFAARAGYQLHVPILSTSWGSDVLLMPKKNFIFRLITKKTLERSACVTANSHEMIRAMQEIHRHETKYKWQQYGIAEIPELSKKENLIFSNRLHEKLYNIQDIISYFLEFHEKQPNWRLIIGGSGSETERLMQQAQVSNASDAIEFTGWLNPEENAHWYSRAKIYISIPKSDGTAISMLEGLAHGCLPILPNLPVSHEWIEHGVTGVIRNEKNNPFEDAVAMLDKDFATLNRDKIKKFALRKDCGNSYFELYKTLIKK
jgi:glycosyltransferase involved in cell wall biosynthesis